MELTYITNMQQLIFKEAFSAIHKMYDNLREPDFYESRFLIFEKVEYVYQALGIGLKK